MKKLAAEFLGTFWLVLGGCGSAVIACTYPELGIGFVGVSLAFGLTVLTSAYSLGHISGAHLNPAVSIGFWAAGRMEGKKVLPHIIAQILGGIVGAAVLYVIVTSNGSEIGEFAANGYGAHSPGGYGVMAAVLTEFIMTFMFLMIILGATSDMAPKGFGGLTIGLALTLIHLISIPVTKTSVNPARSISQAIFVGGWAIEQLWLFILIPVLGALAAGGAHMMVTSEN
jgi:aquaporin Z